MSRTIQGLQTRTTSLALAAVLAVAALAASGSAQASHHHDGSYLAVRFAHALATSHHHSSRRHHGAHRGHRGHHDPHGHGRRHRSFGHGSHQFGSSGPGRYHEGDSCRRVYREDYHRGRPARIGGTLCRDGHGDTYIVPGSRFVAEYY